MQRSLFLLSFLVFALPLGAQSPVAFPPPKTVGDTNRFGAGIQRTMTLLATSTPEKPNTVKILFYGQSITEQKWWKAVADDLRRRFPHANLVITNLAIGGFASQMLVKTAETDLYAFYPDLLIFHVYGSHLEYENIIQRTRRRTTAEILMQLDHITKDADITEETDPAKLTPKSWNAWMNHVFLPGTAQKYGAELCDQHNLWKQYLKDHQLPAAKLLSDSVHLNDHGCYLMAEFVKAHLRYDPALPQSAWQDLVKTYAVGADVPWQEGKLAFEFEGNRVDAILGPDNAAPAQVRIDGKKPSEFPELYGFTRPTSYPGTKWPCLLLATSEAPRLLEEWILTLKDCSDDLKTFKFALRGSRTGADGEGRSDEKFVSRSRRIVIDPADWHLARSRDFTKRPLPADFKITWKIVPYFVDEITLESASSAGAANPHVEHTITLAQGLSNTRHRLELTAAPGKPPIAALRIYRPPGK